MSAQASELARKLNAIEQGNQLIRASRAIAMGGSAVGIVVNPAAIPQIIKTSRWVTKTIAAKQDLELMGWQVSQAKWILKRGCDGEKDLFLPLPSVAGSRPPQDLYGSKTLTLNRKTKGFTIRLWRENLIAAAKVEMKEADVDGKPKTEWTAHWTPWAGTF